MKLEPRARKPVYKSVDALIAEAEPDEFDIQQVLLRRKADIQLAFQALADRVESDPRFNLDTLPKVADLLMVDQATQGQLLPSEVKQHVLTLMKEKIPILNQEAVSRLLSGHFECLKYGAWAQLFPEEPDWVRLDDEYVRSALQEIARRRPTILSVERWVLCLMQIRPDRQADFRQLVPTESFTNHLWLNRADHFTPVSQLWLFLEALASLYVIHPEAREQLVLSAKEKRDILKCVRQFPPGPGFESMLRNVTIVLADESILQANGQVEIRCKPKAVGGQRRLPERTHV